MKIETKRKGKRKRKERKDRGRKERYRKGKVRCKGTGMNEEDEKTRKGK